LSRISKTLGRFALSFTLIAAPAVAEPNDGEASALGKQAMDSDYLGTQFNDAEQKLQKALDLCEKGACSSKVRAQLHLNLGIVYIAGLKKTEKGQKELQAAVATDGSVPLNPDFSTPAVEKAFTAAGGVLSEDEEEEEAPKAAPKKRADPDEDEDDRPAKRAKDDEDEDDKPAAPHDSAAGVAKQNWISLAFQQDLLSFKDTTGVCSGAAQYQCFLQGQSYGGPFYAGSGNQLKGGVGFATRRILLGFDRLLGDNITLGAKVGFAFSGSPKATTGNGSAFLPIHAELRGSYWFGTKPFASDGLRGYVGAAVGLAEVDAHVTVEYYPDVTYYNAGSKGKIDAWRKTGNVIAGLHGGIAYGFSNQHQLFLELRVLQMLGETALGGAVNIGYAYGM
jgi:hypothetical protein